MKVSAIGLGTWLTFGGRLADDDATQLVREALAMGINFFDTADVYEMGKGEHALGRALYTSTPRAVWGEPIPNQFEIVGITRNVKFLGPDAADEPAFYVPSRQFPLGQMTLVAVTRCLERGRAAGRAGVMVGV